MGGHAGAGARAHVRARGSYASCMRIWLRMHPAAGGRRGVCCRRERRRSSVLPSMQQPQCRSHAACMKQSSGSRAYRRGPETRPRGCHVVGSEVNPPPSHPGASPYRGLCLGRGAVPQPGAAGRCTPGPARSGVRSAIMSASAPTRPDEYNKREQCFRCPERARRCNFSAIMR